MDKRTINFQKDFEQRDLIKLPTVKVGNLKSSNKEILYIEAQELQQLLPTALNINQGVLQIDSNQLLALCVAKIQELEEDLNFACDKIANMELYIEAKQPKKRTSKKQK